MTMDNQGSLLGLAISQRLTEKRAKTMLTCAYKMKCSFRPTNEAGSPYEGDWSTYLNMHLVLLQHLVELVLTLLCDEHALCGRDAPATRQAVVQRDLRLAQATPPTSLINKRIHQEQANNPPPQSD